LHLKQRWAPSSSSLPHWTHTVSSLMPRRLRLTRKARLL
jgi:hypothetical protein